jgi:HPt (histidine-containing phosphotransfer) domain-containing protein
MIKVAAEGDTVCAPPLVPDQQAIDLEQLARLTFGDRGLEAEVLRLFDRQSELLLARMGKVAPNGIAALAHTLKGSARGIGAQAVADAAEAVEQAVGQCGTVAPSEPMRRLSAAVAEAQAVIATLLRTHRT